MTEVETNAVCPPSLISRGIITDHACPPPCAVAPVPMTVDTTARVKASAVRGSLHGQALISRALLNRVNQIDSDSCSPGGEDPFFVADIGEVYRQHVRWKLNLPRVEPFYAVKCNPDLKVLKLLARLGTGFDCASKKEMDLIMSLGVPASRIIYAHPCKASSFIRYASQRDVRKMTFDNAEELHKIKRYYPEAELFLRIVTDDSESLCQFSMKYGASLSHTADLLQLAKELDLNVAGISFHVGSGAVGGKPFLQAVRSARFVFDQAEAIGMNITTLDIGGGFGVDNFESIAEVVGPAIDELFPPTVRVIAEPGRYYVASAYTLACHVIARRELPRPGNYMLYLNDGVYGNMNCILFDHQQPVVRALTHGSRYMYGLPENCAGPVTASVWGPTCDGIDCVTRECQLPYALDVGDWVYFDNFGAYTLSAATGFNGFNDNCEVLYVCSENGAKKLMSE
ncbi:pyridoxal-dependent decarboxylase [Lipomyces kononenkoae]|uniref:Pyridoxal-dependent decarboxylase n=1 Tax=Lipomyces kononenkoae TaxID=34357 RepID=A0ACC3T1W5_LIPKO